MAGIRVLAVLLSATVIACSLSSSESATVVRNTTTENIYRLPSNVIPIHYNVRVIPDVSGESSLLQGESNTIIKVLREAVEIVFHAKKLTIQEDLTSLKDSDSNIHIPKEHSYDNDTQMLHLVFNGVLMPGVYTMNLTFNGEMSEDLYGFYNSFYYTEDSRMVSVAATHLQPIAARRVFPCWDEPALKATFNISIKHFNNYTALSNMPLYKQEHDETDGKVWSHFQTTPLMSTNILAFFVSDYVNRTNADETIRVWTRKDAIMHTTNALDVAIRANRIFEEYLNSTVRVPKMDHVSIPRYSTRATENWGLIMYTEHAFLYNEEQHRTTTRWDSTMTIVHEISHQWFGNLVSPSWWKYFWMSEGMATYFKSYMTDKLYNDWRLMDLFVVSIHQNGAFAAEDSYNAVPLNNNVSSPEEIRRRDPRIIYRKSAAVIRMLSHIVSEDVFRAGLIKYIAANEYDSVTSDDLWEAMQAALDESGIIHTQVKDVMDTWVEQGGYPIVTVARDYDSGRATLYQESITADKDPIQKRWWIPLNYATKSNPNFDSTLPSDWLKPDVENVIIDVNNDDWIIVNVQETGYYRVNYDDQNWRKIARFLNSEEYTKIHPLNRAQIINDAYYMVKRGKLDPTTFFHIIDYLARETDFVPWLAAFTILRDEWKYFFDPEGERVFKPYVAQLMNNLVQNTSFDESIDDNDFTRFSRSEVSSLACKMGHPLCLAKATAKLIAHLDNPANTKLTPDMIYWTYCVGLARANQTIWNRVLETGNLTSKKIHYLGCTEDPEIAKNYLTMSIDGQSDIWKQYGNDVAMTLNNDVPSHTETLLNFVINEWQRISVMVPEPYDVLDDLFYRIKMPDQLERFKTFLLQRGIPEDITLRYSNPPLETMRKNVKDMLDIFNRYRNDTEDASSAKD